MTHPSTAGLVWTRPATSGGMARPTLTRDKVVRAAIELLDTDGVDGLSMRRLGARLDAAATTLYWHVRSKEELLDLAFDEVMGELGDPTANPTGNWRTDIAAALTGLRTMMLRHRWYPRLFSTRPSIGPQALRFWAGMVELLLRAGFSGAELDHAFAMLSDYVIGTTAIHVSYDQWLRSRPDDIEPVHAYVREAVRPYPTYAAYIFDYIATTDPSHRRDDRYAYALDRMLDALAMRLGPALE